jgi:O-methyltransferase
MHGDETFIKLFINFKEKVKGTCLKVIYKILYHKKAVLVLYDDPDRSKIFNLISSIRNERELLLSNGEAYSVFMAVKRTAKVEGDIAEVGVYKGASAKIICQAKGDKNLHLFDTFEGIPKVDTVDLPNFYAGQYTAALDDVKAYLKNFNHVFFYKGFFPTTTEPIEMKKFSFVHLDVDTYSSTLACMKFFYRRMSSGGVIISHDYINKKGVKKAVDEFFINKPEPVLELCGSQCLIVKI